MAWISEYQTRGGSSDSAVIDAPVDSSSDGVAKQGLESVLESGALAAFEKTGSAWNYTKIMMVGEGRSGKSTFSIRIIGDPFVETDSTIGIDQLTCVVNQVAANGTGGSWAKSTGRVKEYEHAIARRIKQARENTLQREEKSILDSASLLDRRPIDVIDNDAAFQAMSLSGAHIGHATTSFPAPAPPSTPATATAPVTPAGVGGVGGGAITGSAETVFLKVEKRSPDEEMIARCLANEIESSSSLHISIFDYGGQDVFTTIHHLFLTANGVYALCFNMMWLVAEDESERERSLKYLKFWIDSIYMHTFNVKTEQCAPFILIGTHKDKVPHPEQHHEVDFILNGFFKSSKAWYSKLENTEGVGKDGARATLCFFAVDNTRGRDDPVLMQAMACMERAMHEAEYTHVKVPLEWLSLIDALRETKKSFFELSTFTEIAMKNGVKEAHIPLILRFLHEMGMCMYVDEESLKDLVIMDAIEYLVTPAAMIICNHHGSATDKTRHKLPPDIMTEMSKSSVQPRWMDLVNNGILAKSLLPLLWKDRLSEVNRLLSLTTQFGLIVPLFQDETVPDVQYVVPSLLPMCTDPEITDFGGNWGDGSEATSCYFFFTLSKALESKSELTCSTLMEEGFCPSGLYERLVGKIIMWNQSTSRDGLFDRNAVALFKEVSILSFGSRCFRVTASSSSRRLNCFRVDVQGANPLVIVQKLSELTTQVINESMKGLSMMLLLPKLDHSRPSVECIQQLEQVDSSSTLLPLTAIKKAVESSHALMHQAKNILSLDDLRTFYGEWLQVFGARDRYDMFISYRWSEYDKPLARQLFDAMSNYTLGSRPIDIFLDVFRLKEGRQFDKEFAKALISSTIVMPLLSMDAILNMKRHNKSSVDNLLLEWMLAYECVEANKRDPQLCRVQSVFPIFIGNRHKVNDANFVQVDPFNFNFHLDLPDVVPEATIARAKEMLVANGITSFTDSFERCTVRSFMGQFKTFLGVQGHDYNYHRLVSTVASEVHKQLQQAGSPSSPHSAPDPGGVVSSPGGVGAASATGGGHAIEGKKSADTSFEEWMMSLRLGDFVEHFVTSKVNDMSIVSDYIGKSKEEIIEDFELESSGMKKPHVNRFCEGITKLRPR